jgi:hypothetical protein
MEDVTITQYSISECGFYADEKYLFGDAGTIFHSFGEWIEGLDSIGESSTYTPNEDDGFLRTFCVDIHSLKAGDARLIVTWNELESVEEGVQVIEIDSKIGEAEVTAVEIDAMSLPGYPAFFFVEPDAGRILNVRFEHRLNGSRQFQRFVTGYMASSSPYCVWDKNNEDQLLGYRENLKSKIAKGAAPEFGTRLVSMPGRQDFLIGRCPDIRKVIRRASVSPQVEAQKTFLDSAYALLGLKPNNRLRADVAFEYQFKVRLTEEKLKAIISEYEKTEEDTWSDVGFTLARESSKVHWLSGAAARGKGRIDVTRTQGGMIDIESLVNYANKNYARLVGISEQDV